MKRNWLSGLLIGFLSFSQTGAWAESPSATENSDSFFERVKQTLVYQLEQARQLQKEGRLREAVIIYESLMDVYETTEPSSAQVWLSCAEAKEALGDRTSAIRLYQEIKVRFEQIPWALEEAERKLALLLARQKDQSEVATVTPPAKPALTQTTSPDGLTLTQLPALFLTNYQIRIDLDPALAEKTISMDFKGLSAEKALEKAAGILNAKVEKSASGFRLLAQASSVQNETLSTGSDLTSMGRLSRDQIQRVIRRNLRSIQSCYEQLIAKDSKVGGKLVLSWEIQPSGEVEKIAIKEDSTNAPELSNCLRDSIRSWKFPRPERGGVVRVTYPFIFRNLQEKEKPEDVPAQYREPMFGEIIKKAIAETGEPIELVGSECSKAPCIAMLRMIIKDGKYVRSNDVSSAKVWKEHFGISAQGLHQKYVECGNDQLEWVMLVNPVYVPGMDPMKLPPGVFEKQSDVFFDKLYNQDAEISERLRRSAVFQVRQDKILSGWKCSPSTMRPRAEIEEERQKSKSIFTSNEMPTPWPQVIPEPYRPERFKAIIEKALSEIDASEFLVGFDCQEPPCIVKLRITGAYNLGELPHSKAWQENFKTSWVSGSSFKVDCGDSRKESVELVSPPWDLQTDPTKLPAGALDQAFHRKMREHTKDTPEDKERANRFMTRCRDIQDNWKCLPAK